MRIYDPFDFFRDIYWCGIPLTCRCCYRVYSCREGWRKGRKCKNGCEKLNIVREQKRKADREDYLDNLVKSFEKR